MAIHVKVRKSGLESSAPSRILPHGWIIKKIANISTEKETAI